MRRSAAGLYFAIDAASDVIARQQFWRTAGALVALGIAPALFRVGRGLRFVVVGDVVEHEATALVVLQDATLTAHALGHEDAFDARRPDHPGGMELDELHVDELRAGAKGEAVSVAGPFPAVARDLVGAADAAGRENHRLGSEDVEATALAVVGDAASRPTAVEEQRDDRVLHVHSDAEIDGVILERPDQLETGAVADVREARVAVATEVALVDAAIRRAVEHGAPAFELPHAIGRLLGVDFRHPPIIEVLPSAHRVGEVDLPVVTLVVIGQRGRHAAFGHHRVRLAEQRLADESD